MIPQETIDAILDRADIVEVVREHVPRPVANGEKKAVAEEIVIISALNVAAH